jgi:hypothetical protein
MSIEDRKFNAKCNRTCPLKTENSMQNATEHVNQRQKIQCEVSHRYAKTATPTIDGGFTVVIEQKNNCTTSLLLIRQKIWINKVQFLRYNRALIENKL